MQPEEKNNLETVQKYPRAVSGKKNWICSGSHLKEQANIMGHFTQNKTVASRKSKDSLLKSTLAKSVQPT